MCRLYSAGPRTSLTGSAAAAASRPASANASSRRLGAGQSDCSASVASMFLSPTAGERRCPARPIEPFDSVERDGDADGGEVADLAFELQVRAAGAGAGGRHADLA